MQTVLLPDCWFLHCCECQTRCPSCPSIPSLSRALSRRDQTWDWRRALRCIQSQPSRLDQLLLSICWQWRHRCYCPRRAQSVLAGLRASPWWDQRVPIGQQLPRLGCKSSTLTWGRIVSGRCTWFCLMEPSCAMWGSEWRCPGRHWQWTKLARLSYWRLGPPQLLIPAIIRTLGWLMQSHGAISRPHLSGSSLWRRNEPVSQSRSGIRSWQTVCDAKPGLISLYAAGLSHRQ